ncbi:hypothetical protein BC936DRAFT_149165 [Jimgerdemannia flammicorona]|uniref:Ketoreductase domain-containing protein n=1 Tax=Jimgerdemannia flammicorona TaxID=994334 RepID=A0A433D1F8_9FUNG|nr:hypothetical protein BC936DRAFT_149165 [Jimgerdemannia flammicorona]
MLELLLPGPRTPSLYDPTNAVLITGASSGIGFDLTTRLAEQGLTVFATVRNHRDARRLDALGERVIAILCDVTNDNMVAEARRLVEDWVDAGRRDGERNLVGVVCNAAVPCPGPIELVGAETVLQVFETNVAGCIAVSKAFLPLLRRARSSGNISPRLVFVSSLAAELAVPGNAVYASSKLALNFLARILRVELRGEVTVSVVLPGTQEIMRHSGISPRSTGSHVHLLPVGAISTPIWNKSTTHLTSLLHQAQYQSSRTSTTPLTPSTVEYYTKLLLQYASINRIAQATASPPSAVSDIVCKALGAWFPKDRYLVGYDAYLLDLLSRVTPEWLWDWVVPVVFAAVL